MSIEFRYANESEYGRIAGFIDEHWAKDHIYVRNPQLFEWTFRRPGFWDSGYSFALGEDDGNLMAILGGIPFTFNNRGVTQRGVWIVNYAVHPDYRKGAAALKLMSMFRNPSFPVVVASGLNPATATIYRVLRGQVLPETPRHFGALPGTTERMEQLIGLANPELETERRGKLAKAVTFAALPPVTDEFGSTLPPTWDAVDWAAQALVSIGAVRDADYLTWRYLQHPCFEYRLLTLPENGRTGLLIWRLETIRQQVGDGRTDIDRIGRLVEFFPASPANGQKLLAGLFADLRKCDAVGVDFYGYNGEVRRMLSEAGIQDVSQTTDGAFLPSRFQPIAGGSGILNAMFADPSLPACTTADDCLWYWTKSDSDQDRPN